MDFLGLKNLTIIESALKIIKNTQGLDIDIDTIPIDNKETYELFQRGETTGVFQFESSGMKRYLRELKPTEFEDIIAMVSLYRPGPMEWIPDYIAGKHKKKQIAYLHPKLEKILDKTYGVAIYQEQVMQIARDLAGFTMGEADVLRKAMGKKIAELLAKQKEKFIDGCVKNSVAKELAEKVFSFIEPFAGYGFNRSHAACYALIGYQTAYLKAHWPTEFMAALLTSDQGDTDRVAIEIEECRNMGIQIMAPDINESFGSFTVVTAGTKYNKNLSELEKANEIKEAQKKKEENNLNQSEHIIRFGLKAIKNIGEHIADVVIEERKENGPYLDLSDFLERITDKDLNKKSLESLIKCGALDHYGERGQLLANMDRLLQFNKDLAKNKDSKQVSLFVDAPISLSLNRLKLESATATDSQQRLAWEKELLGLYVSEHPFNSFKKNLASIITPFNQLSPAFLGSVAVAGVVSTMKKIITRNNQNMLFAKIEDAVSSIELLIFPRTLEETKNIWQEGKVVLCWGKLSNKDQEIKLLVDKVTEITLDGMETQIAEFRKKMVERPRFNSTKNGAGIKKQAGDASSDKQTSQSNSDQNSSSAVITGNPLKLILKVAFSASDLELLRGVILQYPGTEEVYFKITQNGSSNIVKTGFKVENSSALKESLINSFDDKIEVVGN
jgi:DNA polymerase-3 subunit alpha